MGAGSSVAALKTTFSEQCWEFSFVIRQLVIGVWDLAHLVLSNFITSPCFHNIVTNTCGGPSEETFLLVVFDSAC